MRWVDPMAGAVSVVRTVVAPPERVDLTDLAPSTDLARGAGRRPSPTSYPPLPRRPLPLPYRGAPSAVDGGVRVGLGYRVGLRLRGVP